MIELEVKNENQIKRPKVILDLINQSETVTIESNDVLHVNKETLGIKASAFLYNLEQATKKIDIEKYSKILIALNISPHLVANTHAKQILEALSESEQEFFPGREQLSQQEFSSTGERLSGSKSTRKKYKEETDQTPDKEQTSQKMWSFFSRIKKIGSVVFKRTSFVWKHKTTTDSKQAPYRKIPVLFGDKAVFHKVPFNSIKIS